MANEIPPPIQLNKPKRGPDEQIMIPFIIADTPRMFLNFLVNNSAIPKRHREVISEWVMDHNMVLGEYITKTYGPVGAQVANTIAQGMYDHFIKQVAEARKDRDDELFDRLEDEMKELGGGG